MSLRKCIVHVPIWFTGCLFDNNPLLQARYFSGGLFRCESRFIGISQKSDHMTTARGTKGMIEFRNNSIYIRCSKVIPPCHSEVALLFSVVIVSVYSIFGILVYLSTINHKNLCLEIQYNMPTDRFSPVLRFEFPV